MGEFGIDGLDMGAAAATDSVTQAPLRIGTPSRDGPDVNRRPDERLPAGKGNKTWEAKIMPVEIKSVYDVRSNEI
jgi:hypothetical protein